MKLTIDFETRSRCDIRKCGAYKYAEDESTDVLCLAVMIEDIKGGFLYWYPSKWKDLFSNYPAPISDEKLGAMIEHATEIEAHNAPFERAVWANVMVKKYGFKPLPLEKVRCSKAKAATFALPLSLDGACKALGVTEQKDKEGYNIMLRVSKPKRDGSWNENPADWNALLKYCIQDTNAEHALSSALLDLTPEELKIFQLDQKINDRGVPVDIESINIIEAKLEDYEKKVLLEVQTLTGGAVNSTRQVQATRDWLALQGFTSEDLRKSTVDKALKGADVSEEARRLLELRQVLGKSSVGKLTAMRDRASSDGRVRGAFVYGGASRTLRWAGSGIQPQNMPRETCIDAPDNFKAFWTEALEDIYGDLFAGASKAVRSCICAPKGKMFFDADFSAIEGRVLAWLADEFEILEADKRGLDRYKLAAAPVFDKRYEEITKNERQIGKVIELACGYQGFTGAFQNMAQAYGVKVPDEQAAKFIMAWRENRQRTVQLWHGLQEAALKAVKLKNVFSYGRIKFGIRGRFLHMRLPSGRLLSYLDPYTKTEEDKYGRTREVICYKGVNDKNMFVEEHTYGGKLVENCVQAISRDLLANSMLNLEANGFSIVLHCHDEVVTEVDEAQATEENFTRFKEVMKQIPDWASGIPMGVEGWIGKRYRKD